jgi:hypothetical protein
MPARLVPHCKACVVAKALSTTLALPSDWRKQALSTIDLLNLAMMALIDVRISEMLIMEICLISNSSFSILSILMLQP